MFQNKCDALTNVLFIIELSWDFQRKKLFFSRLTRVLFTSVGINVVSIKEYIFLLYVRWRPQEAR
jgi:hypothetical protein